MKRVRSARKSVSTRSRAPPKRKPVRKPVKPKSIMRKYTDSQLKDLKTHVKKKGKHHIEKVLKDYYPQKTNVSFAKKLKEHQQKALKHHHAHRKRVRHIIEISAGIAAAVSGAGILLFPELLGAAEAGIALEAADGVTSGTVGIGTVNAENIALINEVSETALGAESTMVETEFVDAEATNIQSAMNESSYVTPTSLANGANGFERTPGPDTLAMLRYNAEFNVHPQY